MELRQEHNDSSDHGTADQRRDQRRHRACDVVQDRHQSTLDALRLFWGGRSSDIGSQNLCHNGIEFYNIAADDDLTLAAGHIDAKYAVNGLQLVLPDLLGIPDFKTQPCCTVGHAGNIIRAAHSIDDLRCA